MQDPDVFFRMLNEWICEAAGQASAASQPDLEKKGRATPPARQQQQQAAISTRQADRQGTG